MTTGFWSDWRSHDGSGLPAGLYGKTVEVRTTKPFTGKPDEGRLSGFGIAGLTFIQSWHWTWESRMRPLWDQPFCIALPIDEYRVWLDAAEQLTAWEEEAVA